MTAGARPGPRPDRRTRPLVVVAAGAALLTAVASGPASAAGSSGSTALDGSARPAPAASPRVAGAPLQGGNYVVTLKEPSAATYDGGIAGLAATRPGPDAQLDARSAPVQRYTSHLTAAQDSLIGSLGIRPTNRYTVALNGFSARLDASQAARLASDRRVLSVVPDTVRTMDTTDTPELLGLTGGDGVWEQLGGRGKAGTGVVVGVLDTGITPENPMLRGSAVTATSGSRPGDVYRSPDGGLDVLKGDGRVFEGACQSGPSFPKSTCNSKLVSARYFGKAFLANVKDLGAFETVSPRDGDSHGTHTATTATGEFIPDLTISGQSFGRATGMAPQAKLAVYKVLWDAADPAQSGGFTSDLVAGIDQAVADGVDVLNYSIGGSTPDSAVDPVELAFLSAASAGVFVAASAGNDGPGAGTVDKNAPWVTSVAAATAHRFEGTVRTGSGQLLRGASLFGTPLPETPAVLSITVAKKGFSAQDARLCFLGSLDPAKVKGKIVVCDRGTNDRVEKSAAVAQAGGVGMVLVNVTPSETDADKHSVPTIHLEAAEGAVLKAYFTADRTPTLAFLSGDQTGLAPTPVPVVAGFSSRGPAVENGGDLLKPDITGPGVNILAGVAPGPSGGDEFGPESGTSMSSPHIAGLAALVLQDHPLYSPMKIKSAMMTTATDTFNADGTKNTDPFSQGAGFVNPPGFMNPGLFYDSYVPDWLGFLEGIGIDTGTGAKRIDPSDANQPSIAIGSLAGTQTVTRRVTSATAGLFRATASMPGVDVTVSPSVLNFSSARETKSFTVTFRRTTAALDAYTTGTLTWRGAGVSVRSPLAVRPVALSAPAEVSGTGTSGAVSYEVVPGATGPLPLDLHGLVAGQVTSGSVGVGAFRPTPTGDAANRVFRFSVPAGTTLARMDLKALNPNDDMDLYVIDPTFSTIVGVSASGAASERVDLVDPPAGNYYVVVNGFAAASGGTAAFSLRNFAVPATSLGNATVTPDPLPARQGAPAQVTVRWDGLTAGTPYLGTVAYDDSGIETIVSIG